MPRPTAPLLTGALAAALALCAGAARAAPDLTGMWQYDFSKPVAPPPTLKPAVAAVVAKRQAARQAGFVRTVSNMKCLPTGMPEMMQWRSPIEIQQGAGRLSIITEHDPGNDEPRTVYMEEKAHPANLAPSWNGHSVGHWEGDVLVVDTVAFNDRAPLLGGVPRSEKAHIVERLQVADGGKTLKDVMRIEDPEVLTAPWTVTLTYAHLPNTEERLEAVCEPDLEALGKVDLGALKGLDAEADRMTDPSQRYNPGGR